jgi:hypothetical protein
VGLLYEASFFYTFDHFFQCISLQNLASNRRSWIIWPLLLPKTYIVLKIHIQLGFGLG